jgi:hypothetical protein
MRVIIYTGVSSRLEELEIRVVQSNVSLVDLLLLINRELTWAHVDQQEETAA